MRKVRPASLACSSWSLANNADEKLSKPRLFLAMAIHHDSGNINVQGRENPALFNYAFSQLSAPARETDNHRRGCWLVMLHTLLPKQVYVDGTHHGLFQGSVNKYDWPQAVTLAALKPLSVYPRLKKSASQPTCSIKFFGKVYASDNDSWAFCFRRPLEQFTNEMS